MEEINDEFNKLIAQKQNIMLLVKDFQKKITLSVEEINFPSLKKFIDLSLSLPTNENCLFPCNKCNNFVAKSKSSLAAHQKGRECLKIYNSTITVQEKQNLELDLVNIEIIEIENKVESVTKEEIITQVSQNKKSKLVKTK